MAHIDAAVANFSTRVSQTAGAADKQVLGPFRTNAGVVIDFSAFDTLDLTMRMPSLQTPRNATSGGVLGGAAIDVSAGGTVDGTIALPLATVLAALLDYPTLNYDATITGKATSGDSTQLFASGSVGLSAP